MEFAKPVVDVIKERFSCRGYLQRPIGDDERRRLQEAAESIREGPFGTVLRFGLLAATRECSDELKGLGTYGFIRNPAAFIIGTARPGGKYLEDFGYAMERLILTATDLRLGTCWLGGFFTRGSFSRAIKAAEGERIPAVAAVGVVPDPERSRDTIIRRAVSADRRHSWESLFFDGSFEVPLAPDAAGPYASPLEMVRLAPSASNRQPWRIVREGTSWHFFLQRTRGYRAGRLVRMEDIQRVDIGIAMCHFELTARELGLGGRWVLRQPAPGVLRRPTLGVARSPGPAARGLAALGGLVEYAVSWEE